MRTLQLVCLSIFLLYNSLMFSQARMDVGGFGGVSYYMGDINPSKQFYSPQPAVGALIRYNFDQRYSIRGNVLYGTLSANDQDFKNLYQQTRNHSFNTSAFEVAVLAEFNFLPYVVANDKFNRSTYLVAGIAYAMMPSTPSPSQFSIPFGIGYKINLLRNWAFGAEWTLRKTFSDNIDGLNGKDYLNNSYKQTAFANNNDWYSFCGIFLTYMIFSEELKCAAYGEKKKH